MSLIKTSQARGNASITVLHAQDRINIGNTAELEKAATEAFENGARFMVIDLTKAESITSAGIRSIMFIYKMLAGSAQDAQQKSDRLKLVCSNENMRDVLNIAGLTNYIDTFDTLADAVASF